MRSMSLDYVHWRPRDKKTAGTKRALWSNSTRSCTYFEIFVYNCIFAVFSHISLHYSCFNVNVLLLQKVWLKTLLRKLVCTDYSSHSTFSVRKSAHFGFLVKYVQKYETPALLPLPGELQWVCCNNIVRGLNSDTVKLERLWYTLK